VLSLLAPVGGAFAAETVRTAATDAFGQDATNQNAIVAHLMRCKPERTHVIRSLAHAFALTRPPHKDTCATDMIKPAEARKWPNPDVKCEALKAFNNAVSLAFGEVGGSSARLISALLADAGPAALPRICGPRCGFPVLPMSASLAPTDSDIDYALLVTSGSDVLLEQRCRGERVQVHKESGCITVYNSSMQALNELDGSFHEGLGKGLSSCAECILDGVLQKGSDEKYYFAVFDCLYLDGRALTRHPLRERLIALQRFVIERPELQIVKSREYSIENPPDTQSVRDFLAKARAEGCSGAVLKMLESGYESGMSGSRAWVALIAQPIFDGARAGA